MKHRILAGIVSWYHRCRRSIPRLVIGKDEDDIRWRGTDNQRKHCGDYKDGFHEFIWGGSWDDSVVVRDRGVYTDPLHVGRGFDTAAHVAAEAADEVVDEDKLERGLTPFQGRCEPSILRPAECHAPVIISTAVAGGPEWIEHDEQ